MCACMYICIFIWVDYIKPCNDYVIKISKSVYHTKIVFTSIKSRSNRCICTKLPFVFGIFLSVILFLCYLHYNNNTQPPPTPKLFVCPAIIFHLRFKGMYPAAMSLYLYTGLLYVVFRFSTRIIYRGVPGFATVCPCGVWCRGLTACLLYVGPLFENIVWNYSSFVRRNGEQPFCFWLCFYINLNVSPNDNTWFPLPYFPVSNSALFVYITICTLISSCMYIDVVLTLSISILFLVPMV